MQPPFLLELLKTQIGTVPTIVYFTTKCKNRKQNS